MDSRRRPASGLVQMGKVAVLLLVFGVLLESAAGACLSYGASCLGAHGKRSEIHNGPRKTALNRLFLSKLLDGDYQLLPETQAEGDELKNEILMGDESVPLEEFYPRLRPQKPPKYLEKRSPKLI